jgi:tRNA(Ile)-lysidine synthase
LFEKVAKTIIRYSMFAPGDRVAVAVSGGADSVFLLHALFELAPRWGLRLSVVHLDHKLRGAESRADAEFVRELARSFGLPAHMAEADVARAHDNLEQAARLARQQCYMEILAAGKADRIATGHTRSDQAETVLFRFLRGSGSAGLAGIRPLTADGLVRPLIELSRDEIRAWLSDRGISWREDSTNAAADFARNRIRHTLLPALARDWNPAIEETLAHTAEWAQDEEAYWESEIARVAGEKLRDGRLSCRELTAMPRAIARRLVRKAIEQVKGDLRGVSFQHVEQILMLAASQEGDGRLQIPGVEVLRSFDWVRFVIFSANEPGDFSIPVQAPGAYPLPNQRFTLRLEVIETASRGDCVYNGGMEVLDGERVRGLLTLRNWRPGDQYKPLGRSSEEKIKNLFQQARIPLWERHNWPILTIGEQIVWARRFGPASDFAATSASRSVVKVWEERA